MGPICAAPRVFRHCQGAFHHEDDKTLYFIRTRSKDGSTLIHKVLTLNLTQWKLGPVCQIFILHQINLEKNGFHSLTDWLIGLCTI